jgi:hypothetical protein
MRDVREARPFPGLRPMEPGCEVQSLVESRAELERRQTEPPIVSSISRR